MAKLRNSFFTGLIVLLPLVVTVYFLKLLIAGADAYIVDPLIRLFSRFLPFQLLDQQVLVVLAKILVFLIVIALVTLFGLATRVILVKQFLGMGEGILLRVPLVNKIYKTIQQISHAFLGQKHIFERVVLIEYPRPGVYAIGFVTSQARGEVEAKTGRTCLNVFIPTTPNPTSGVILMVPEDETKPLDMSVEDGMKLVVSSGVVAPAPWEIKG